MFSHVFVVCLRRRSNTTRDAGSEPGGVVGRGVQPFVASTPEVPVFCGMRPRGSVFSLHRSQPALARWLAAARVTIDARMLCGGPGTGHRGLAMSTKTRVGYDRDAKPAITVPEEEQRRIGE